MNLARSALNNSRLKTVIEGDFILSIPNRKENASHRKYDHETTLHRAVQSDGTVVFPSFENPKEFDAFREWIYRQGSRVAENTYRLNEGTKAHKAMVAILQSRSETSTTLGV